MSSTATSAPTGSLSHLPWAMVPTFRPGETDINDYSKRLEFIARLWPQEHLHLLGPRAAMQCEGSAFKRLMRTDPDKLRANSLEGIKLIVSTLGGVWGRAKHEEKFEKFERAIFSTTQRSDEANESYLARHDNQFEELLSMKVTLEEMRSYILLRNSGLSQEDKKKLIYDSGGTLDYNKVVDAIKLLGSRFFQEVQGGQKNSQKVKTYDTNMVQEDEPMTGFGNDEEPTFFGEVTEEALDVLGDEGDQDVLVVQQFEDSLIETIQSDPDIATCYNTYLEARRRLTDKAKNRGFWPGGNSGKGKGGGKFSKGGKNKGSWRFRKPLAQRILESECKRCFQKGHWKAECPLRFAGAAGGPSNSSPPNKETTAFAGVAEALSTEIENDMIMCEVVEQNHAEDATLLNFIPTEVVEQTICFLGNENNTNHTPNHPQRRRDLSKKILPSMQRLIPSLRTRLRAIPSPQPEKTVDVCFASQGPCGIVDLGASQSVIGQRQVQELLDNLPTALQSKVQKIACNTVFRFGNSSTVSCDHALLFPLSRWFVKVCVVRTNTPFLLSNNVFRTLQAVIDTAGDTVVFRRLGFEMPLTLSGRKLYLIDFCELLRKAHEKTSREQSSFDSEVQVTENSCMTCETHDAETKNSSDQMSINVSPQLHLASKEPDSRKELDLCLDHVGRDERSCSALQEVDACPESSRRDHPDSCDGLSGTGPMSHLLRRRSPGKDLLRGCEDRSEVCGMVLSTLARQQEARTHPIPEVCEAALRRDGKDHPTESKDYPRSSDQSQVSSNGVHLDAGTLRDRGSAIHGRDLRDGQCYVGSGPGSGVQSAARPALGAGLVTGDRASPSPDSAADQSSPPELAGRPAIDLSPNQTAALCETLGQHELALGRSPIDVEYFESLICDVVKLSNSQPIIQEMMQFLSKSHECSLSDVWKHFERPGIDLLEVYCSAESELTNQGIKAGLTVRRFGLRQGDLSTFVGRCALYDQLWKFRPRHVWLAPKCGPWSNWSRLNMGKSITLESKILQERHSEKIHLQVCSGLFVFQLLRGPRFHSHVEQPLGSELMIQRELRPVTDHSLRAVCDMCTAGNLVHPETHEKLRKGTQIWTTSTIMHRALEQYQCVGDHPHDTIQGSCNPHGQGRMPVSKYTELYTKVFASRVVKMMSCSLMQDEMQTIPIESSQRERQCFATDDQELIDQAPKRRRLITKSPADDLTREVDAQVQTAVQELVSHAEKIAPKIGKMIIEQGELFEMFQQAFPSYRLRIIEICKGTDRLRAPPIPLLKGEAPLRLQCGRDRTFMKPFCDVKWEDWEILSQRQRCRKDRACRLSITLFGRHGVIPRPESPIQSETSTASGSRDETPEAGTDPPEVPSSAKSARASHGPKFGALPKDVQTQLMRMHSNLGHPDARTFVNALRDNNWDPMVLEAVPDLNCDICHEQKGPRISRPSHLKEPRDFNDLVSFDSVDWTDEQGKKHSFFHMIDSASNFHIAIPQLDRSTQNLMSMLKTNWFRWAGPPKAMMFDSAGEAGSEQFGKFLQEHDIRSYTIPTGAHWQLGRCERHGAILQSMLDKYHAEHPIRNALDLEQALLNLCNAKNSLSRHRGYSPEILVLGKCQRLPGSNINEEMSSVDLDACSEKSWFHEQLKKRETARIAFVRADNCLTLRRALHGRSRPFRQTFQIGEFVMFWREGRGALEGSWIGPGKVLMHEGDNLVWISHLTRLYRCAPEHVRSLSRREQDHAEMLPETTLLPVSGSGVFQYHQLENQSNPPEGTWVGPRTADTTIPTILENPPESNANSPFVRQETNEPPVSSIGQPDAEPELAPVESMPSDSNSQPNSLPDVAMIPVPSEDEGLIACHEKDYWETHGSLLIRHHVKPRISKFFPWFTSDCPHEISQLLPMRVTQGRFRQGETFRDEEDWKGEMQAHQTKGEIWTGKTIFFRDPSSVPEKEERSEEANVLEKQAQTCFEVEIVLSESEIVQCGLKQPADQEIFLASAAKRQKVEVKTKELSPRELQEFLAAKKQRNRPMAVNRYSSSCVTRQNPRTSNPQMSLGPHLEKSRCHRTS